VTEVEDAVRVVLVMNLLRRTKDAPSRPQAESNLQNVRSRVVNLDGSLERSDQHIPPSKRV